MTYKEEEDDCVRMLLAGLPEGTLSVKKASLETLVRAAFNGGWTMALLASKKISVDGVKVTVQ